MKKIVLCLFSIIFIFALTSCNVDVITMPYDSSEYKNGEWTLESLVEHFETLGFTDIDVTNVKDSFGEAKVEIYNVNIEDSSSDSWFTEYKAFKKGEEFGSWLKIKIETHTFTPTLTVDNCSDLANIIQSDTSNTDAINSFMNAHNGEYIEFCGTITDWNDKWFWVGVDLTVAVEDSKSLSFVWDTIDLIDLKLEGDYHYNKYKTGLISEGMKVHMIVKVDSEDNKWKLEIYTMEILK